MHKLLHNAHFIALSLISPVYTVSRTATSPCSPASSPDRTNLQRYIRGMFTPHPSFSRDKYLGELCIREHSPALSSPYNDRDESARRRATHYVRVRPKFARNFRKFIVAIRCYYTGDNERSFIKRNIAFVCRELPG